MIAELTAGQKAIMYRTRDEWINELRKAAANRQDYLIR
jgi:hypothetical protein